MNDVPHGTPYRYRSGCRCADCDASARRDRDWRFPKPNDVDDWTPVERYAHARSHAAIVDGHVRAGYLSMLSARRRAS